MALDVRWITLATTMLCTLDAANSTGIGLFGSRMTNRSPFLLRLAPCVLRTNCILPPLIFAKARPRNNAKIKFRRQKIPKNPIVFYRDIPVVRPRTQQSLRSKTTWSGPRLDRSVRWLARNLKAPNKQYSIQTI